MPKISVIVPVFGVEKYIERCARSLFEQSLEDIEFVFVDDCTPDNSMNILQQVISKYPQRTGQIKILKHEKNLGLPKARYTGIKHSSGKYIAHCDSDDWVDSCMYEKMYNKALEDNADIVISDYYKTDGYSYKRHTIGCRNTKKEIYLRNLFSPLEDWCVWNKLINKNLYDSSFIYPEGPMGEDMLFTCQVVCKAKKISALHEGLYFYFFNPASITNVCTEKMVMKNYHDLKDNIVKVYSFLESTITDESFLSYLNFFLRYLESTPLTPLIENKNIWKLWRTICPKMPFSFYMDKRFSTNVKIAYLFHCMKVNPSNINFF